MMGGINQPSENYFLGVPIRVTIEYFLEDIRIFPVMVVRFIGEEDKVNAMEEVVSVLGVYI